MKCDYCGSLSHEEPECPILVSQSERAMSKATGPLPVVAAVTGGWPLCRCGCGNAAVWLITGVDFGGETYTDDPACDTAAAYCEEAAHELGLPFSRRRIDSTGTEANTPVSESAKPASL